MNPINQSLLFVIGATPFNPSARDALDAVLVAAAFQQTISVLFIQSGIYQLMTDQQPNLLQARNLAASWRALPLYDVNQIYVCESSLVQYKIQAEQLVMPVKVLSVVAIQNLMQEQHAVFNY